MNTSITYLLEYLKDEFRGEEDVRIRPSPTTVAMRSPDLEQDLDDYEPPSAGVYVRVGSRDYFFPASWAAGGQFSEVQRLVQEIREKLVN